MAVRPSVRPLSVPLPEPFEDKIERYLKFLDDGIRAPKIRRYLLFYVCLLAFCFYVYFSRISPAWQESRQLTESLSAQNRLRSGGTFGENDRPTFSDMIHIATLDEKYLPSSETSKWSNSPKRRLIFIGDIHGCKHELVALLDHARYNPERDHIVATGDVVMKGPDSLGVIDLLRKTGASCVRGNHDDRVLLIANDLNSTLLHNAGRNPNDLDTMDEESFSHADAQERGLAASLSPAQLAYLRSCPLILRVGSMKCLGGEIIVVHAGLVPGLDLRNQDPFNVMNMRTIDLATHVPSKEPKAPGAVPWTKLWNQYQRLLPSPYTLLPFKDATRQRQKEIHTTVIYGHDARRGLQLEKYSKGLDSGCVRGGKLTALILSDGGKWEVKQVKGKDYRPRKLLKVEVEDILRDGKLTKPLPAQKEPDVE